MTIAQYGTTMTLDPRALANIRALENRGAPNLLASLVEIFLEDTQNVVNNLRVAVRTGDARGMQHMSHRLKGSSGNFGARALVSVCEELETLGSRGLTQGAAEVFQRLEKEYRRVRNALEQLRVKREAA